MSRSCRSFDLTLSGQWGGAQLIMECFRKPDKDASLAAAHSMHAQCGSAPRLMFDSALLLHRPWPLVCLALQCLLCTSGCRLKDTLRTGSRRSWPGWTLGVCGCGVVVVDYARRH